MLGPFYVEGAPEVPSGSNLIKRDDGHEKVLVEGIVTDADGKPFIAGTPIARVESERYQLQIDIAKADYERAQQSVARRFGGMVARRFARTAAVKAGLAVVSAEFILTGILRQQVDLQSWAM